MKKTFTDECFEAVECKGFSYCGVRDYERRILELIRRLNRACAVIKSECYCDREAGECTVCKEVKELEAPLNEEK